MKYSLGIIGLGHISEKYQIGLEQSSIFKLVSVCDISENAHSIEKYHTYPVYQNYIEMIKKEHLEYVLISTPPKLHYQMALQCLKLGCHVLLEKPGALKVDELIHLYKTAELLHKKIDVIYHWQYGNEALFMKSNIDLFKIIKSIKFQINDPYLVKPRMINPNYYGLEGCWLDSSLNALSFLALIMPIDSLMIQQQRFRYDQLSKLPYEAHTVMFSGNVRISVDICWRVKKNYKVTYIETDKGLFEINHTKQTIYLNKEVIYCGNEEDRLSTHYSNYFRHFHSQNENNVDSILIHHIAINHQGKRGNKNE